VGISLITSVATAPARRAIAEHVGARAVPDGPRTLPRPVPTSP